ncbi:MAG: hypothetical protein ACRERS_09255 [Methylococcales bacterium]
MAEKSSAPSWSNLREIDIETYDVPYPGREKFWPTFKEENWSGGITDGKYYLTNSTDPGGLQYMWQEMKFDASNLPVTADVSFADSQKNSLSAAGLLYRFDERTKFYYAFCIGRDGLYTFYRRDANGVNPISSGRAQINGKTDIRLGIIGDGGQLRLYVNDVLVKVVQDDALKSGFSGVAAAGLGAFGFDNLTVYAATSQPPQ